ncbi:molybdenum cofactor guanylyltransferase MobA [Pacificibacter sp. AS14]|uniref:molybdenum cofactor guanylyltransferase MobA n=1 Tax=Pacificibacter sp. AS14 TaxID=3135785 RepID=UPI003170EEF2
MTTLPAMILAGGLGTRMGTRDKALCQLGGKTLLELGLARLGAQCSTIALNANGNLTRFDPFKKQVIPDPLEGHLGPLSGILAAMDWAAGLGHASVITTAVDTPFFPHDLARRLISERTEGKIALAGTRDETGRLRLHPTFGIWPTDSRDQLRADLLAGTRKVTQWTQAQNADVIVFETKTFDPFFNINTPEDLERAEHLLARDI